MANDSVSKAELDRSLLVILNGMSFKSLMQIPEFYDVLIDRFGDAALELAQANKKGGF